MAFPAAPAPAALTSGQIVVVDARAFAPGCADVGAPGCGGLIGVDPTSGAETALSSNAMPVNASSQLFDIPFTLALDGSGNVLVANTWGMGGSCQHGCGGVLRIDPSTGKETVVSSNDQPVNASSHYFQQPTGMTVDAHGNILVADWGNCPGCGEVIRVDPATGKQTLLSSNAMAVNASSQYFKYVQGIAVDRSGTILVTDPLSVGSPPCTEAAGCGAIIAVDPATGKEKRISSNAMPVNSSSQDFHAPLGIVVDGSGRILVSDASTCCPGVIGVDPATGKETLVSSNSMPVNASSRYFDSATGIAVDGAGHILVADQGAFGGSCSGYDGCGGVIEVDATTGKETKLAANDMNINASSQLFVDPFSVAVVPPTAGGGGTLPPDTRITKFNRHGKRVSFRFRGSGGKAPLHFQCRLDSHRFSPCHSPKAYRHLAAGRHTFRVRAVDAAGRVDQSPAARTV